MKGHITIYVVELYNIITVEVNIIVYRRTQNVLHDIQLNSFYSQCPIEFIEYLFRHDHFTSWIIGIFKCHVRGTY